MRDLNLMKSGLVVIVVGQILRTISGINPSCSGSSNSVCVDILTLLQLVVSILTVLGFIFLAFGFSRFVGRVEAHLRSEDSNRQSKMMFVVLQLFGRG